MTYDAADGYVLLFGGEDTFGSTLNDTWTFSNGTWSQLTPALSPPARTFAAMTYDAADRYVLLFGGGTGQASGFLNDAWTFSAGVWSQVQPTGVVPWPSARRGPNLAYDALDGYVVMFGGQDYTTSYNDTWTYLAGNWTLLSPNRAPPGRFVGAMTYDARYQYILLFGGCTTLSGCTTQLNDAWAFRAGQWIELDQNFAVDPSTRGAASIAWDAVDGYVLLFGGALTGVHSNETWTYDWPLSVEFRTPTVSAEVGVPFAVSAEALGGSLSYHYALNVTNGSCPASNATAWLCTFSAPGTTTLTLRANDSVGELASTVLNMSVLPAVGASLVVQPHESEVHLSVTYQTNITGGQATYHYTYTGLAPGCVATSAPTIVCVLTTPGNFTTTVTISDSLGGRSMATTDLVVLPALVLAVPSLAGDAHVPLSVTPMASGGLSPFTISWPVAPTGCTPNATSVLQCNLTGPGVFGVTASVTDGLGATVSSSAVLTIADVPRATVSAQPAAALAPADVTLALATSGGTAPWNITWDFGDGSPMVFGSTGPSHRYTAPGSYVITAWANDSVGAHVVAATSVVLVQPMAVSLVVSAPGNETDAGLSVVYSTNVTDGYPPFSYVWQGLPAGCLAGSAANVTCRNLLPGSVSTSVKVTDGLGEVRTALAFLSINRAISASPYASAAQVACGLIPTQTLVANASGGTGALNATWQFGDGSSGVGLSTTHSYAASGVYAASVTLSDQRNASQVVHLSVNVSAAACPAPATTVGSLSLALLIGGIVVLVVVAAVAVVLLRRRRSPPTDATSTEEVPVEPPAAE